MLALLVLAIAMAGCAAPTTTPAVTPAATPTLQASGTPAPTGPHPTAQAPVEIRNFAFDPHEVRLAKGGTVTWTNNDSVTHTVSFGGVQSPGFGNGGTYSRTFNDTGTFDYICGIHPSMTGKVVVE
jgi:plastocyanin